MYYASIYHSGAFYIFGGGTGQYTNTIARLDAETTTWSNAGEMVNIRRDHGAIFDGEKFLVVGGHTDGGIPAKNEVCTFTETLVITCAELSTIEIEYMLHPELLLVPEDYGKGKENCFY